VAAGHRVGGGGDPRVLLDASCAIELLQAYFLIHDDWMDNDRVRRGGPSVHARLEADGWTPELAARGAVLAGDYTLALATRLFAGAIAGAPAPGSLLAHFASMQLDAVVGQQLDVLGDGEDPEGLYRLKTGSYSVAGPLKLGLMLADASAPLLDGTDAFATPLGVAFQLRDDLIGAYAEAAVSGKPKGSDLLAGKRTLLVQLALERCSSAEREVIQLALGNADASVEAVTAALESMDRCGARAGVEARIAELVTEARRALEGMPLAADDRVLLGSVISVLIEREL
jgi:geranylgeranyl diphosphate synthase type I